MIDLIATEQVYLACGATDLRRSIDGLSALVQMNFKLNPFSSSLFVFCNKNRNRIKILKWDGSGYWLLMKRLDSGCFRSIRYKNCNNEGTAVDFRRIIRGTTKSI